MLGAHRKSLGLSVVWGYIGLAGGPLQLHLEASVNEGPSVGVLTSPGLQVDK